MIKSFEQSKPSGQLERLSEEISGESLGQLVYYTFMYSQGNHALQQSIHKYVAAVSKPVITERSLTEFQEQLKRPGSASHGLFSRLLSRHHHPREYVGIGETEELRPTVVDAILTEATGLQEAAGNPPTDDTISRAAAIATTCLRRDAKFWFGKGEHKVIRKRSQFIEYVVMGKIPPGPAVFAQLFSDAREHGIQKPFLIDLPLASDVQKMFDEYNVDVSNLEKINFELHPEPDGIVVDLVLHLDTPDKM